MEGGKPPGAHKGERWTLLMTLPSSVTMLRKKRKGVGEFMT